MSWRHALPLAALTLFTLGVLLAIIVAARNAERGQAPPVPGPMAQPAGPPYLTLAVERVEGRTLVATGGGRVDVPSGAPVWLLGPAIGAIPGSPIAVIGVPNEVRNATIRAIVLGLHGTPSGRVAGPFSGHEALGEANALPLVEGTVAEVSGDNGHLTVLTAGGKAAVWLGAGAPLFEVREGGFDDIQPGDRVAVMRRDDGSPDPALGLLVMPGE